MDDPDLWRWIWLGTAVSFGLGEMSTPGAFFLAPFGIGAGVAAIASFLGASLLAGWLLFVVVSVIALVALRPLAARLDLSSPSPLGVGATRLVGDEGMVIETIPAGVDALGLVRIGREEWRAQSVDSSVSLPPGTTVTVHEVVGTRVVVYPIGLPRSDGPPTDQREV